jgi:hypothetical protein
VFHPADALYLKMHTLKFSRLSSYAILLAAYAFQISSAQSPPGFQPPISNHLMVSYRSHAINPAGITVPVDGKLIHHYDLSHTYKI